MDNLPLKVFEIGLTAGITTLSLSIIAGREDPRACASA
jgi:hypothetical protein